MGGHDQSQVKIKFKKFEKTKSVPKDVPKSHNDDKMKRCTQKWDRRNNQGPNLETINTCHQLVGIVRTGLYHSMADVQSVHWGRGGLEINKNILSTLQALVESTCHLPADIRLGTFQMFLQVPG